MESILAAIDAHINTLQTARTALTGGSKPTATRGPGRPKAATAFQLGTSAAAEKSKKRKGSMSPEGRARVAAAQKARWAKIKAGKK